MRSHRSAGNARPAAPCDGGHDDKLQRRLQLVLVTHPPVGGDRIGDLARKLMAPHAQLEAAVDALAAAGLAHRHASNVSASAAALRFEELWPTI